jgi:hypothetical protein
MRYETFLQFCLEKSDDSKIAVIDTSNIGLSCRPEPNPLYQVYGPELHVEDGNRRSTATTCSSKPLRGRFLFL